MELDIINYVLLIYRIIYCRKLSEIIDIVYLFKFYVQFES